MIAESPLAKKLRINAAQQVLLVNPPENYAQALDPLPREAKLNFKAEGTYDVVQLFVKNRTELKRDLVWLTDHLRPDTVFWITYPKKSSGIESDLEMMQSWEETSKYGLDGVAAVAIDQTWTALRFRPKDQVKRSEACNSELEKNPIGEYIDVKNRNVTLPEDLKAILETRPEALLFFESLSYTNRKEYVTWVLTAKQEKTRTDRIGKSLEKLLAGKKNPAEK